VSASSDSAFMIWDLAAGACVGSYRVSAPITSMSFHPDGLFLATTHLGEHGSFLWTNNLRYGFVPDVVENPLECEFDRLPMLHCPSVHMEDADEDVDAPKANETEAQREQRAALVRALEGGAEEDVELFDESKDVALATKRRCEEVKRQLNEVECAGLRTSGLPRSVWFNLTVLDQIKEKNMPLVAPKKKDVPFFLPTTSELRPTFIVQTPIDADDSKQQQKRGDAVADVQQDLMDGRYDEAMQKLTTSSSTTNSNSQSRSAAEIDLHIQSAVDYIVDVEYTAEEKKRMRSQLGHLLKFFTYHLRLQRNVDLVEGMIASALKAHGAYFVRAATEQQELLHQDEDDEETASEEEIPLVQTMEELLSAQQTVRLQLQHLVGYPNCMLSYFTGAMV